MKSFGVYVDDWLAEELESSLGYGDSRSDRAAKLIRVGLAAEKASSRVGHWPNDIEEAEEYVQDAIEYYHEHGPE